MYTLRLSTLPYLLNVEKKGEREIEIPFKGAVRMIFMAGIRKNIVSDTTTDYFDIIHTDDSKHVIGMYDEINSFVSYVKETVEDSSPSEVADVLVGEPGNKNHTTNKMWKYKNPQPGELDAVTDIRLKSHITATARLIREQNNRTIGIPLRICGIFNKDGN